MSHTTAPELHSFLQLKVQSVSVWQCTWLLQQCSNSKPLCESFAHCFMQSRLSLGLTTAYFALSTGRELTPGAQRDSNCICQLVDTILHPAPGLIVEDDVLGNGLHLRSHVALVRVQLPLPHAGDLKRVLLFFDPQQQFCHVLQANIAPAVFA